mmetsp:Transcript_23905/g.43460  ORF Transcript_23905/g.43460 Transcript_23905/m.43460 type:complete len:91 (-) Transcript_23905:1631-1903(-)
MPDTPTARPMPSVQFDWQDWLPYMEDTDLTDAQKREMIETLWSIVLAFVDLGWDVTDSPKETCGQVLDLQAALEAAVLNSTHTEQEQEEA